MEELPVSAPVSCPLAIDDRQPQSYFLAAR